MKALELCKEALRILRRDKGDEYRYNVGILLKEAIEELELIQSKINCDNCQKFDTRVNVCYQNGCKDFEDWELWTKIKDT